MNCTGCDAALPVKARFCPSCGARIKWWEGQTVDSPIAHMADGGQGPDSRTAPATQDRDALQARLIDCYVNFSMSRELSEWLEELGAPSTGTMQEKLSRLRRQTSSLVLPAESLPRQVMWYLHQYDEDILGEICRDLGIDGSGPKDRLVTRIYLAVGTREGWLQPLSEDARQIITETFLPILRAVDRQNDYDLDQWGDLGNMLAKERTNRLAPQAHGSAFMTVLIPGFLQEAQGTLLQDEFKARGTTVPDHARRRAAQP